MAFALLTPLLTAAAPADAGEGEHAAVDNHRRRQQLLHRSWPDDGVPGSVLVTAATPAIAAEIAGREGGDVVGNRHVLVQVEPGAEGDTAARIAARGGILDVEPDRVRHVDATPDDPGFADQWAHRLVDADEAWNTTTGSASVTVAVLDTGVDGRHADLAPNLVEQADVSSGTTRVHDTLRDNDVCDVGHGTFVAGVVGAAGDNGIGVAGVAWDVSIVDVALTSRASRCGILDSAIIAGVDHVVDRDDPVDVINLSLGGISDSCPTALQAAFDDARDAGVLVVAAAGNEQEFIEGAISVPASCDGVLSVGAVGETGAITSYSNANPYVDVAAPGGDTFTGAGVLSTAPNGGYAELQGTSFAAPYVAGIAALMLSVDPSLTPDELEAILEDTARDRGPSGRDDSYGWGLVDAAAAVDVADAGTVPALEPDDPFPVRGSMSVIERVSPAGTTTTPTQQAVAMSQYTFEPEQALHAIVARVDDFADALAGSSLGFGLGPLLFTSKDGPLSGLTREELVRAVQPGGTVYLLGGTAALPATLEDEIRDLGFEPVRLAGATRMQTSVVVARAVEDMLDELGFASSTQVMLATAFNWPDAVSAGSLGAWFGMPILVTPPDALDAAVRELLDESVLDGVYIIGGTAAISDAVVRAVRDTTQLASGDIVRLAGTDRSATTVAVSAEMERAFSEQFQAAFGVPVVPGIVAAVNLRRPDGFAHVLSASMIVGAYGGVFAPVEGVAGDTMTSTAQQYVCRFPATGVVVGGTDVIAEAMATQLDQLLRGEHPACRSSG